MRKSRDAHLERNARKAAEHFIYIGHLFFAEDYQVVQIPLVRLSVEDFVRPVSIAMRSHFLTVTAAGKGGAFSSRIPSRPTWERPGMRASDFSGHLLTI